MNVQTFFRDFVGAKAYNEIHELFSEEELIEHAAVMIAQLQPNDRLIICGHYGFFGTKKTHEEIGNEHKPPIPASCVPLKKVRAVKKLNYYGRSASFFEAYAERKARAVERAHQRICYELS